MADQQKNNAKKELPKSYARRVPSPGHSRIADKVRVLIAPVAEALGLSLWDVVYVKEGADYILRVTIDSEKGVTIDDCEAMSCALDPILDEADPIEQSYLLEVSSPGIERDLTREEHFSACAGQKVTVRLFAPLTVNGQKVYTGILRGLDPDGQIILEVADQTLTFSRASVSGVKTVFDFQNK